MKADAGKSAYAFFGRTGLLDGFIFKVFSLGLEFPALLGTGVVWQRVACDNGHWFGLHYAGGGFFSVGDAFEPDADGGWRGTDAEREYCFVEWLYGDGVGRDYWTRGCDRAAGNAEPYSGDGSECEC